MLTEKKIIRQKNRISKLIQPTAKQKITLATRTFVNKVVSSKGDENLYGIAVDVLNDKFDSQCDIDALIMLVMFEFWQSEEEALKKLLEEIHRMNQIKKRQREYLIYLKKLKAKLKTVKGEFKDSKKELDDQENNIVFLSGLTEETSLKLQIALERRSKIMQTLSSILKKVSQTQDSIIQNIK